jgi:hypothetical protein
MNRSTLIPGRQLTAVLLVLAPLAELIESALSPLKGSSTTADLNAIAAHQGRFEVSVLIGMLLGTMVYIPALLGLAEACSARTPRLARVAGWISVATIVGFAAARMIQAFELQTVTDHLSRPVAAHLVDHAAVNIVGAPLMVIFLAGTVIGFILLAVATWRSGFPRPAAVLLGMFPVLDHLVDGHGRVMVLSHVALLVALGWLASALRQPAGNDVESQAGRAMATVAR